MKSENLFMLCALAVCPVAAHAQSTLTLYGDVDEYVGYIHSSTGKHVVGVNDGTYLRSRIGVRGAEDLGGGYRTTFTLESGFGANNGAMADSTRLFDRQAWVGLATPSGEVRIGRQNTEIFAIGGAIDYTERTTFGSLINTFGTPSRFNDDISYKTARVDGLQFTVHYALAESGAVSSSAAGTTTNQGAQLVYQLALDYIHGPYRVGYAGLASKPNSVTATVHETIVYHNVYADYNYGAGTLYLAAVRSNNVTSSANGNDTAAILNNVGSPSNNVVGTDLNAWRFYNIVQVSADYRLTPQFRVGALVGVVHDTSGGDAGVRGGNVGGFYDLSKRTMLYGFVSYMKNQANGGFRFSGSAAPTANLAAADVNGKGLLGLQLGIVARF